MDFSVVLGKAGMNLLLSYFVCLQAYACEVHVCIQVFASVRCTACCTTSRFWDETTQKGATQNKKQAKQSIPPTVPQEF